MDDGFWRRDYHAGLQTVGRGGANRVSSRGAGGEGRCEGDWGCGVTDGERCHKGR